MLTILVSKGFPSTPTTTQFKSGRTCAPSFCISMHRPTHLELDWHAPFHKMGSAADLTFVSITGPILDKVNAKAMRAHTTRANFARRRRRLVRDYADQKESAARIGSLRIREDGLNTDRGLVIDIQHPIFSHPGLNYRLNRKDAFFIHHCA